MRSAALATITLLIGLPSCTDNTSPGNDREARLEPSEPPAERAPASSLSGIDADLLKPEPMSEADIASLPAEDGTCLFRYTEVGFPVLRYPADGAAPATIKLNGELIDLPAAGGSTFAVAGFRVEMRHPAGLPTDGHETAELIMRLRGASDERGFRGAAECPDRRAGSAS